MDGSSYDEERVPDEAVILIQGMRMVLLRAETFVNIQRSMVDIQGDEALAGFYEAGINAGRSSAKVLLQKWNLKGKEFINKWAEFYSSIGVGWFKLQGITFNEKGDIERLLIDQSFIADEYPKTDEPVCHFLAGFFVGVSMEVFGKKLICEEKECRAKGNRYCRFVFELV